MSSATEPRSGRRVSYPAAARLLSARDPVVAELVGAVGPPRLRPPQETNFEALVRAIVYQQLAGAAAATIHGRLVATLGGQVEPVTVISMPVESLRAAGLSANKAASVGDLATRVVDGRLALEPRRLARESDEELIARLSEVRGIGRWTAEMFLIFQLRRLDVWPTGDLGVRRGYGLAWQVAMPTARALEPMGDTFRPYRSVVAWYCWRACELYAGSTTSRVSG